MKCQRCGETTYETDGVQNDVVVNTCQLPHDFIADFCPKCYNEFKEELLTSQEWIEWSKATTTYNRIEESHPIFGMDCPLGLFKEYLALVQEYDQKCMNWYIPLIKKITSLLKKRTG